MENAPNTSRTVLLADSDGAFRLALARVLSERGHQVIGAATFAEARHAALSLRGAVMITDLCLPDGDGLSLLAAVTRNETGSLPPIMRAIVLTSFGTISAAVAAAKAGAADFLAKPSDADTIEAAMRRTASLEPADAFVRPTEFEFRYILTMFEQHDRNLSETARAISMHRRTLQRVLRRHGIAPVASGENDRPDEALKSDRLAHLWTHLLTSKAEPVLLGTSPQTGLDHTSQQQ
jgi:two-component system, response regulator RegA